jgi:hypothetical protein
MHIRCVYIYIERESYFVAKVEIQRNIGSYEPRSVSPGSFVDASMVVDGRSCDELMLFQSATFSQIHSCWSSVQSTLNM